MPTALPVPIEFRLPKTWHPAPPEQTGAPDVAFLALHPHPDAGFTANITINGEYRPDTATLAEIADASVQRMQDIADSVVLNDRKDAGSADAPALTQTLSFSAVAGGVRRDLTQSQVYLTMLDVHDPHQRAVITLALTATTAQHDSVLSDFQEFVRTVRPDTRAV